MKVKVKDVKANPYRNIDHYPLNKDKIMSLTSSIENTGFWDNLVGRKVNGEIQIAYGHHRIEALRLAKGYGYDFEFDLPIKDIDDVTMIKIMANENMSEWGHSVIVIDETVKVAKKFLENSPPFLAGKNGQKPRTNPEYKTQASAEDIAEFLGWKHRKVTGSLLRINAIKDGLSEEAVTKFQPEKSKYFVKAMRETDFTTQEQEEIADDLVRRDVSRDKIKEEIKVKVFEKKYPKSKSPKGSEKVIKFEHKLLHIASAMTSLSDDMLKLKLMHGEIKNISTEKGNGNIRILFASVGKLQRRLNEFLEVMAMDSEMTEDNINTLKQLK